MSSLKGSYKIFIIFTTIFAGFLRPSSRLAWGSAPVFMSGAHRLVQSSRTPSGKAKPTNNMSSRIFARTLASAAKSRPPIQLFGVDGTYASALYSASVEQSSPDAAFQGLGKVSDLIKNDAKIGHFLQNPALLKDDRATVVSTISENLKLDKTLTNFLTVLSENNRLSEFESIYNNFGKLFDAYKGVVEARITSSKPLDNKALKRLQTAIQKSSFVGEDKTLKVVTEVQPDILGGLIVEVGDKTLDLSIASKVSKLNQALGEAL